MAETNRKRGYMRKYNPLVVPQIPTSQYTKDLRFPMVAPG